MYALAALGCLVAIMLIPLAGILIVMALAALHIILLYIVLPILIVRFLWDLFTNPRSSFANLVARVRAWGVARRSAAEGYRAARASLSGAGGRVWSFVRRRRAPVDVTPKGE